MMDLEEFKQKYNVENWLLKPKQKEEGVTEESGRTDYTYIAKLLMHPVADGRHRLLWLVIAPYIVNILQIEPLDEAENVIQKWMDACVALKSTDAGNTISYYVNHAYYQGLLPPSLNRLQQSDPDLYETVKEVIKDDTD